MRRRRIQFLAAIGLVTVARLVRGETAPPATYDLRVGYSARVFVGLNESDAKLALRVWMQTVGAEQQLSVDPVVPTFADATAIVEAFKHDAVDGVSMLAEEYWAIRRQVPLGLLVVGVRQHRVSDEYVLLVRRDRAIESLRDLHGLTLTVMRNSRSALGPAWLEWRLLTDGLAPLAQFWGRLVDASTASRAVLPVFFGQADACLTTREAFQTIVELNPQVGHQLRVLLLSPELVSSVFCFRGTLPAETSRRMQLGIPRVPASIAGRQLMTLFQSEGLVVADAGVMERTCELLDGHAALLAAARQRPVAARLAAPNPDTSP